MVKAAQREKPPVQKLADKISAWFVPIVLAISVGTFAVEYFALDFQLKNAVLNAIAVLVISCPCAMGLATPTAVMVGVGRAAKKGILIRSGKALEELGNVKTVVFDKTGTLTTGKFISLRFGFMNEADEAEVKRAVWSLEKQSSHPIAKSILALMTEQEMMPMKAVREEMGIGVFGTDENNNEWRIGSWRVAPNEKVKHDFFVVKNGIPVASVDLQDEIKPGAKETIDYLLSKDIQVVLLSGDRKEKCDEVAGKLGIKNIFAEQLPDEKLKRISDYAAKGTTVMVGDGINDAPSLSRANVGISLSDASKAAINSAQVIVPGENNLLVVKTAIQIGKKSMITIRQNLFWAFFYNVIAIPIAAAGFLTPMIAALAMSFSDVIVIGNSLLLRTKKLN
jgi:Cu+-exporting ATPase